MSSEDCKSLPCVRLFPGRLQNYRASLLLAFSLIGIICLLLVTRYVQHQARMQIVWKRCLETFAGKSEHKTIVQPQLEGEDIVIDLYVASKRVLDGTLALIEDLWVKQARKLDMNVVYHTDLPIAELEHQASRHGMQAVWIRERFPTEDPPGGPLRAEHEVQKGIVLSLMHTISLLYPGRRYYLSVEDDTVLNPQRLLQWLRADPQLQDTSAMWIAGHRYPSNLIWGGMAVFSQGIAEAFVENMWLLSCMLDFDTYKILNKNKFHENEYTLTRPGAVANDDHYWSWCALQLATKRGSNFKNAELFDRRCQVIMANVEEVTPEMWKSGIPVAVHNVKSNQKRRQAALLLGMHYDYKA